MADEYECVKSGDGDHASNEDTGLCYWCGTPVEGPCLMPCGTVLEIPELAREHIPGCATCMGNFGNPEPTEGEKR